MALLELDVQGYRSLRDIRVPLRQLNVITGPNGSGKSNLYRALWLISQICEGDFARELSDGTLKFLCLAACLLSPRPTTLIALNEPESSLHPDLLPSLAELIVNASKTSQIWVSTHSTVLAASIQSLSRSLPLRLQLVNGETIIEAEDND